MLETDTNAWNAFLEVIKKSISKTEFENWFSPIILLEKEEDKYVLQVPNIFVQDYLLENYKKQLSSFFPLDEKKQLAIEFVIQEPKKSTRAIVNEIKTKQVVKLNPTYTFENFIEGPSNQFVKSAAIGVAARPGNSFNPLFIHGGVGLGKTHLMHAIGHHVLEKHKKLKVQCITTEAFINDLVNNLRNKSVDKYKKFYRNLDVLLVDDIQFLQNRMNFEEEFCNTFEALINQNKQIVITSDKPPSHLKLSERITQRMEWGLVANIGMPDLETRVAIIQHKSESKGCPISEQVAFFIAERVCQNVRQLEGAINRLCAYAHIMHHPITTDMVESTLKEMLQKVLPKMVSIDGILDSVCKIFSISKSQIKGKSRQKEIAKARQIAMYLAKEMLEGSLNQIASHFGGKTHSTLLHAWKKICQEIESDETLKRQIDMVKNNLNG